MKILAVTHQYPPAVGGSEIYLAGICEQLVYRGHQVDVATSRSLDYLTWKGKLPGTECCGGVQIHRFRCIRKGLLARKLASFGYRMRTRGAGRVAELCILAGNGPLSAGLAWHLLTRGRNYDLILIQTLPYSHFVYGFYCARSTRRPIVVTPHLHVDQPEVFGLQSYKRVLCAADMVVAVSGFEARYLETLGVAPERILVSGNSVDPRTLPQRPQQECRARLGIPLDAFVVLFLGRKEAYKGLATLAAAHRLLLDRHPTAFLISAGPHTAYSRELVASHATAPRWIDYDTVSNESRIDLLNACNVLALPSKAEAFGIVFLEAWITGKPVIGARAGAIPWIIDHEQNGLLVDADSPPELAKAIERLLTDRDLAERLARNGNQKALLVYNRERLVEGLEAAFQSLVRQNTLSRRAAGQFGH